MLVTRAKVAVKKALIRTKSTPVETAEEVVETTPETTPETPTRRLRLTSANTAMDASKTATRAKAAIDEQLKVISKSEADIDVAAAQITQANKIIEAQLQLAGLTHHTDGVYLAEIIDQWTNQSRNIDPKKFKNQVTNDVFWESIEVSLTKAKAHLTEKEINEIADVVPSQFKGKILKVKKLGPRVRKPKE